MLISSIMGPAVRGDRPHCPVSLSCEQEELIKGRQSIILTIIGLRCYGQKISSFR